jgi:tRNA dimethylallyltransferase
MDIGTAKPTAEEQARMPHHLIDIVDPDEILSLAVFQQKAREVIADIHTRNKLPFLVGGTGQYVRAVTEGWIPPEVAPNPELREELEKWKEERGINWLYEKLMDLDPEAAERIDPRNFRRTIRALEVIMTTGKKFSEQRGQSDSPYHLITVGLTRPREELYQRVDERIETMFANGFIDEVKRLLEKGYSPSLPTMSAIGYRECVGVIQGELTEEQAKVRYDAPRGYMSAGRRTGSRSPIRISVGSGSKKESLTKSSHRFASDYKTPPRTAAKAEQNIRELVDF